MWDLDEDEWFTACPVVLDFEGERVEINHWKFDEVPITWMGEASQFPSQKSVRPGCIRPRTWIST